MPRPRKPRTLTLSLANLDDLVQWFPDHTISTVYELLERGSFQFAKEARCREGTAHYGTIRIVYDIFADTVNRRVAAFVTRFCAAASSWSHIAAYSYAFWIAQRFIETHPNRVTSAVFAEMETMRVTRRLSFDALFYYLESGSYQPRNERNRIILALIIYAFLDPAYLRDPKVRAETEVAAAFRGQLDVKPQLPDRSRGRMRVMA